MPKLVDRALLALFVVGVCVTPSESAPGWAWLLWCGVWSFGVGLMMFIEDWHTTRSKRF